MNADIAGGIGVIGLVVWLAADIVTKGRYRVGRPQETDDPGIGMPFRRAK